MHGETGEGLLGHDHRVPVPGRDPGDEPGPLVTTGVVLGGDQHVRCGVELEELAGELLEHVVRDDQRRFAGESQPA